MKKKKKGLRFSGTCSLITISVIGTVLLLHHNLSVTFTPVSYSESNEAYRQSLYRLVSHLFIRI